MTVPLSTLLPVSIILPFLSFWALSHSFLSELCNFLGSCSKCYAAELHLNWSLVPRCPGHWASGAGCLHQGLRREGVTVMARKQKTSAPVHVHAWLYVCKVVTVVLTQGKTELTLTDIDKFPCFLCKWEVVVAPSLHLMKASVLQMYARFYHSTSTILYTTGLRETASKTAESREV